MSAKPDRKRYIFITGIILILALVFIYFFYGSRQNTPAKDTTDQASSATLHIGIEQGILTFDPHNNGSFGTPLMNIFDTLVRMNPAGKFIPNLVRQFSRKDELTWSFSLQPNITFHNGDSLTSKDVKFSLERVARDKALLENPRFNTIETVNIINDTDFDIVTKVPDPVLLNRLIRMGGSILPQKYFVEHGVDYFNLHPVGSGPYKVMSYEMDRKLVLKKFSGYFKGNVSDWDDAIFSVLPGEATRVNELVTGGMDVVAEVPPAEWPRVNNHNGTKVVDAASTQVLLLMVNANKEFPTSDKRVRQAIEHAIDSRLIVEKLFGGLGTPTRTHITPGILGFDKDLYNKSNYDLKKSIALLQDAGYTADKPLKLKFQIPKGRYLMDSELGQLIAAMLAQAGIQVQMELLENSKYVQVRNNNKNEALMLAGYGNSMYDPFLPLNALNSKVYYKRLGYRNPKLDALLDQAMTTVDADKRSQAYIDAQQILADDLPYIYIYNERYFTGINTDRVQYLPPSTKDILLEEIKRKP